MVELNPDADYAPETARQAERHGDVIAAQGWRAMRWASVDRQQRGEPTHLSITDWPA